MAEKNDFAPQAADGFAWPEVTMDDVRRYMAAEGIERDPYSVAAEAWNRANPDKAPITGQTIRDKDRGGFWGGLQLLGEAVYDAVTDQLPEDIARMWRGGDVTPETRGWADDMIARQQRDRAARIPSRQEVEGDWVAKSLYNGPQSVATSLATGLGGMGLGAAAGAAAGPAGSLVGGMVGAGALSGAAFYRMAKDSFVEEVRDRAVEVLGRDLSQEEAVTLNAAIDEDATNFGLWEAGPEAISQFFTAGLLGGAGGAVLKRIGLGSLAEAVGGRAVTRVGAKVAAEVAEEEATELTTYFGQEKLRQQYGLRPDAPSLGEFGEEQAGAVLVGAGLQMGGMAAGRHAWNRYQARRQADALERELDAAADAASNTGNTAGWDNVTGGTGAASGPGGGLRLTAALDSGETVDLLGGGEHPHGRGESGETSLHDSSTRETPPQAGTANVPSADGITVAGAPVAVNAAAQAPSASPMPPVSAAQPPAMQEGQGAQAAPTLPTQAQLTATQEAPRADTTVMAQGLGLPAPEALPAEAAPPAHVMPAQALPQALPAQQPPLPAATTAASPAMPPVQAAPAAPVPRGAASPAEAVTMRPAQAGAEALTAAQPAQETANETAHEAASPAAEPVREVPMSRADMLKRLPEGLRAEARRLPNGRIREMLDMVEAAREAEAQNALTDGAAGVSSAEISLEQGAAARPQTEETGHGRYDDEAGRDAAGAGRDKGDAGTAAERASGDAAGTAGGSAGRSDRGHAAMEGERGTAVGTAVVRIPNRASEAVTYEILETGGVRASHLPEAGFQKTPGYALENERRYHDEPASQRKVQENAANLDPAFLLESVDANHGAPVIDRQGNVLGGNGRAMSVRLAYEKFPQRAAAYREALRGAARRLGIDPARVDGMERPVLVRRLERDLGPEERQELVSALNDTFTDSKDRRASGKSRGDRLSRKTLEALASGMAEADTLRQYFDDPASAGVVDLLIQDGVIQKTERNAYVGADGLLNPDGKRVVEEALRGRVARSYETLAALPGPVLAKIDAAIPHLLIAEGVGRAWDITHHMRDAIDLMAEFRASGEKVPETFLGRVDMLKGSAPSERYSKAAQALFLNLNRLRKAEYVRDFAAYAGQAKISPEAGGMPGAGMTQERAAREFLGIEPETGKERKAAAKAGALNKEPPEAPAVPQTFSRTRGDGQRIPPSHSEGVETSIPPAKSEGKAQAAEKAKERQTPEGPRASLASRGKQERLRESARRARNDVAILRRAAGVPETGALDAAQWEAVQEFTARGFEKYLAEGNAPSKELEGVFARMKRWLLRLYASWKDYLGGELSDDVRRVFDRMLAAEKAFRATLTEEERAVLRREEERLAREMEAVTGSRDKAESNARLFAAHASAFADAYGADPVELMRNVRVEAGTAENAPVEGGALFQPTREEIRAGDEALKRDAAAWAGTVDGIAANGLPSSPVRLLSQTPLVMRLIGEDAVSKKIAAGGGVYAAPHVFDGTHPNMTPDMWKQLPEAMADPIAIFDTANPKHRGKGDIVFMVEIQDANGATVVVPVALKVRGGYGLPKINILKSAYAKESNGEPSNGWFIQQVKKNARYVNGQKLRRWLQAAGATSPLESSFEDVIATIAEGAHPSNAAGNKVVTEADLVKLREANPTLYQLAYHGSPHRFSQFTLDHIGTGEGAQAHGWGLYFAREKNIANDYRERLRKGRSRGQLFEVDIPENDVLVDEQKSFSQQPDAVQKALRHIYRGFSGEQLRPVRDEQKARVRPDRKMLEEIHALELELQEVRRGRNALETINAEKPAGDARNPFGNASRFARWEENLKRLYTEEQRERLRNDPAFLEKEKAAKEEQFAALEAKIAEARDALQARVEKTRAAIDRADIDTLLEGMDGAELYSGLDIVTGSRREASLLLNANGIKGITYDGQQDGRCFVVFDDKAIETLNTFYQRSAAGSPRASVTFDPDGGAVMRLFKGADASSIPHEAAHIFLDDLRRVAESGGIPSSQGYGFVADNNKDVARGMAADGPRASLASRHERGPDTTPVKVVEVDPSVVPKSVKARDLAKWLKSYFEDKREATILSTGKKVRFSNGNLEASLKRSREASHNQAYAGLSDLVRLAEFDSIENRDERHPNLNGQEVYYSALRIGESLYAVKMKFDVPSDKESNYRKTVLKEESLEDLRYKDHTLREIEIAPVLYREPARNNAGFTQTTRAITKVSLGVLRNAVKPSRLEGGTLSSVQAAGRFLPGREAGARPLPAAREALRRVVDKLNARAANGADVRLADTMGDLPAHLRKAFDGKAVEGVYDPETGTVWLVADQLGDPQRAAEVWAHETLAHHGLRALLNAGERKLLLNQLWLQMGGMGHPLIAETARRYGIDPRGDVEGRLTVMEEALAKLAERRAKGLLNARDKAPEQSLWRRVVAAVLRAWQGLVKRLTGREGSMDAAGMERLLDSLQGYVMDGKQERSLSKGNVSPREKSSASIGDTGEAVVVSSDELGVPENADVKEYRKAAREVYRELQKTPAYREDLGEIQFTKAGWSEATHTGADKRKWALFPKLKEIIQKAEYIERQGLTKVRSDNITAFHWLEADVVLDGNVLRVGIHVAEDANGNKFYNLNQDLRGWADKYKAPGAFPANSNAGPQELRDASASGEINIRLSEPDGNTSEKAHPAKEAPLASLHSAPGGGAREQAAAVARRLRAIAGRGVSEDVEELLRDPEQGRLIPREDLGKLERLCKLPHWIAKDHPKFAAIYNRQLRRVDERRAALLDATSRVPLLFDGDAKARLNAAEERQLGEMIWKWDGKEIGALQGIEKFLTTGTTLNGRRELELNPRYQEKFREWLDTQPEPARVREAFAQVRAVLDDAFLKAYRRMAGMADLADTDLELFRTEMGNQPNYFPHQRKGKYFVQATEGAGTPDDPRTVVFRQHFDVPLGSSVREEWAKIVSANRAAHPGATWSRPREVTRLPDDILGAPIDPQAMEQLITAAVNRQVKDADQAEDVRKALLSGVSDILKARGFGAHGIRRQGIPGFEKEDVKGVLYTYLSGLNGWLSKMDASADFAKALGQIDASRSPDLWGYASQYVHDMLRNTDSIDRIAGNIKTLAFAWYLGGNIKTAAVNATQNLIVGVPRLQQDVSGGGALWLRAAMDTLGLRFSGRGLSGGGVKKLTPDEARMLEDLYGAGVIADAHMDEIRGQMARSPALRAWERFVRVLGMPMSIVEHFNRASLALAAYRAARAGRLSGKACRRLGVNAGERLSHDAARDFADTLVRDSHFEYGRGNAPELLRGTAVGRMISPAFVFRSFTGNILNLWWRALWHEGREGRVFVAKSLGATVALGGLTAFPFYATLSALCTALSGDDEDWTTHVRRALPESDLLRDVVCYGLPSLGGVSLGGSLRMETPFTGGLEKRLEKGASFQDAMTESIVSLIGIPYDLAVVKPSKALEAQKHGAWDRALEALVPTFAANLMAAYRLGTEGQTTLRGRPINTPGEKGARHLSGYEAGAKALGFQPTSSTKSYAAWRAGSLRDAVRGGHIDDFTVQALEDLEERGRPYMMRELRRRLTAWNAAREAEGKPGMKIMPKDVLRRVASRRRENRPTPAQRAKGAAQKALWGV